MTSRKESHNFTEFMVYGALHDHSALLTRILITHTYNTFYNKPIQDGGPSLEEMRMHLFGLTGY